MTSIGKRRVFTLLGIVVLISLALFYFMVDPEMSRIMPQCVFHRLTGYDCPGCGSQRMIHSLLHADFRSAWNHNPFLMIMIPVILFYTWLDLFPGKTPRLFRIFHSPLMIAGLGAAIILWGVLRNIPF